MIPYTTALLFAIPGFMLLLLAELAYGIYKKEIHFNLYDTISSLSSGITNSIKDSLGLAIVLISYPLLLQYVQVYEIPNSWLVYVIAFIAIDFSEYWIHRVSHKVNLFWNRHVIHHSSEEFNLACALRQPVSNLVGIFAVFLLPAAILGVPSDVILLIAPIHLFMQFWYHTRYIGKLGFLEYIIVTPSQHRVHHAINPEYIDKNLAPIFCIWDRMFGTFQEELEDVPPVYGVLKQPNTWNPIRINFQHIWGLIQDAWYTQSWKDKCRLWFMPTGWRPADVKVSRPRMAIEDVYNFKKYKTKASKGQSWYAAIRFVTTLFFLLCLLYQFQYFAYPHLLFYGLFICIGIYGYTAMMDNDPLGVLFEVLFALSGIIYILYFEQWFGISGFIPTLVFIVYFVWVLFNVIQYGIRQHGRTLDHQQV